MKSKNGLDNYNNLVWLCTKGQKLIHAITKKIIEKYLGLLSFNKE